MVVVGGGAIGCASAWFLAREGLRVTLLEREDIAGEASGAAAGMLAPVGERVHAGADAGEPMLRWGLRSLALFPELCATLKEQSGVDPELEPSGLLRVARTPGEAEALRELARVVGAEAARPGLALGPGLEWLDARAARAAEPALADDLAAALWSPHEAHVRSPLLSRAFAESARRLGARILRGQPVQGLLREGRRVVGVRTAAGDLAAGTVVLCMGAAAAGLGDWLDGTWAPPVVPVRGQILSLDAARIALGSIVWGEGAYLVPKRDGSVVVGATEERVGFDRRVTARGMARLLAAAPTLVPSLADATFLRGWAGLRPGTPDGLPGIGAVPGWAGLLVAVGHHRNGVLLSPVTGQLVAQLVLGKSLSDDARVFDPARWSTSDARA